MSDQDEDLPTLSADTFAALKQFYKEEEEREAIKISTKDQPVQDMTNFNEDWNLSQFWYDDQTAETLAKECVRIAGIEGKIACISAPSAYAAIKKHFPDSQGNFLHSHFFSQEFTKWILCLGDIVVIDEFLQFVTCHVVNVVIVIFDLFRRFDDDIIFLLVNGFFGQFYKIFCDSFLQICLDFRL